MEIVFAVAVENDSYSRLDDAHASDLLQFDTLCTNYFWIIQTLFFLTN